MDKITIIFLMILDCIIGALGAIQLKLASQNITLKFKQIHKNIYNKNLILGVFLYALALSIVIFLFSKSQLNLIYPLTSITYIFTTLLSKVVLKEKITKNKWFALLFIVLGNILITS